MCDSVLMEVLKNDYDLCYIKDLDLMAELVVIIFDKFSKASSLAILHHEKQCIGLLKSKLQLN